MAARTSSGDSLEALKPLVGEWRLLATFEWLLGERFLIQRWEVSISGAPDGIAIIGPDPEISGNYLQHYFDTRGVARVYKMSFENGVWKLWRDEADFSPLDFSQRYTGTFSDDGKTWEHDFDLTYTKA